MKQFRITFTEEEMTQFESIIGEIPTKWGNPLINSYANKIEVMVEEVKPKKVRPVNMPTQDVYADEEPTKPIGGGGGGGAPKPPTSE